MADELAKVKRERDQFKTEINQLREGSKRWANSDAALRPADGSGFGSPLCWNCWERGHRADSCRPSRSNAERKSLRIAKGIPAPPEYTRRRAEYQEARKAEEKKSVAFIGSISDSGSEGGYDLSMSHITSGEFTAAPARGNDLPGSVYPQPRLRRHEVEREPERWKVEPWLRTAPVPVPLMVSSPERPPPERQVHDVEEESKVERQPEAEEKKEAKPEVAEPKAEETPAVPEEPKEEATSKEPVAVEETPVVEETPKGEETSAPDVSEPVHDEPQETETAADVFEPVDGPVAEPAKETEEVVPVHESEPVTEEVKEVAAVPEADAPIEENAEVAKEPEVIPKPIAVEEVVPIEPEHAPEPEEFERNLACLRYMSRYTPDLAHKTKFISDKLRGWKICEDPWPSKKLPKGKKKMRLADEQPKIWRKRPKYSEFASKTRYPYSQDGDPPATLLFGYSPRTGW
jgi:chemotaxis protein histidine kinase CheA